MRKKLTFIVKYKVVQLFFKKKHIISSGHETVKILEVIDSLPFTSQNVLNIFSNIQKHFFFQKQTSKI